MKSVAEQRVTFTEADVNILHAQAMPFMYWMPPGGAQTHADHGAPAAGAGRLRTPGN